MAQYKPYTDQTPRYMRHALFRINQTKRTFRDARQTGAMIREGKNGYFKFPKWHIMSHYPEWIKRYRNAMGFSTGIREVMYITWIKDFFKQTNMRKGYEKQILDYNVEKFSLMVRDNIDLFSSNEILTSADENVALQVNFMSGAKKIREELKWYIQKSERLRLGQS